MPAGIIKVILEFLAELFGKGLTAKVKATDAHTTNETRTKFNTLKDRIKPDAGGDAGKP